MCGHRCTTEGCTEKGNPALCWKKGLPHVRQTEKQPALDYAYNYRVKAPKPKVMMALDYIHLNGRIHHAAGSEGEADLTHFLQRLV
jgi:hypothetical protein